MAKRTPPNHEVESNIALWMHETYFLTQWTLWASLLRLRDLSIYRSWLTAPCFLRTLLLPHQSLDGGCRHYEGLWSESTRLQLDRHSKDSRGQSESSYGPLCRNFLPSSFVAASLQGHSFDLALQHIGAQSFKVSSFDETRLSTALFRRNSPVLRRASLETSLKLPSCCNPRPSLKLRNAERANPITKLDPLFS